MGRNSAAAAVRSDRFSSYRTEAIISAMQRCFKTRFDTFLNFVIKVGKGYARRLTQRRQALVFFDPFVSWVQAPLFRIFEDFWTNGRNFE
jgi:hypothetical protein